MDHLIQPHGGTLVDLHVVGDRQNVLKELSLHIASISLSERQMCDLELLMNGAFSPLTSFMTSPDYESVVDRMRLQDGTIWPIPICLDISAVEAEQLEAGQSIALRDPEGFMLAVMHVEDIWPIDKKRESQMIYGTTNTFHPGVEYLLNQTRSHYVGGKIEGVNEPLHSDFRELRLSPREVRAACAKLGWRRMVGFQTRNPLHRAQFEVTLRAMRETKANLLLQPVVGLTKPGDINYYTRVRCYQAASRHYPPNMMLLALIPLAMRMAGPREALWHAFIRKNYGCNYFIIGRDHAGPGGVDQAGEPFYEPYAAQELVNQYKDEIGMQIIPFEEMVYVKEKDRFFPRNEIDDDDTVKTLSGTRLRELLRSGFEIPDWYTFPEVVEELKKAYPPREKQGFTIFLTGLSGSGKSTIARVLLSRFLEMGDRPVTLLDGDIVRRHLSSELGFSKEHRDINVRRIGFVASEITKNRGIAICAPIAPYSLSRRQIREMIEQYGGFIETHVATPLEVCEQRDRKGIYAKARAGLIKGFTGVDDPYEIPQNPEVTIDTTDMTPDEAAQEILLELQKQGYIK